MDIPVPSIVFHLSLLTVKSVDLVVANDGFLFITEKFRIFILATLITHLFFKYLSICTQVENSYFVFQMIIDILGRTMPFAWVHQS